MTVSFFFICLFICSSLDDNVSGLRTRASFRDELLLYYDDSNNNNSNQVLFNEKSSSSEDRVLLRGIEYCQSAANVFFCLRGDPGGDPDGKSCEEGR